MTLVVTGEPSMEKAWACLNVLWSRQPLGRNTARLDGLPLPCSLLGTRFASFFRAPRV
jgi:hypothetical protein